MPMDIERYVDDPQRQELVKEVRRKIDELGIEYLYLQFVSITGRIMGKGIPADHWESVAKKGFQLVYGATVNLFLDRHGEYLGYGPEAAELVGIPDPETFMQLPWDKRIARMYCTLFRNREEKKDPGGFLTADCRGNLRRLHQAFQDKHHGLSLRTGTEPEMMWLKKDENGKPNGGYSNPYCYHIDQFESLRPVYMRVIEYCRKMGLDMIQGDHEDSPGQLELNFMFDDVLRTADRLSTYRQICAQVAREFGIIACFMCKPFMGVSANGCHHNISLWRGGEDKMRPTGNDPDKLPGMPHNYMYVSGGDNTFMPDTDDVQLPGKIGLGGDRRHRQASARADRGGLVDGELLSPAVGHGLLGAGVRRLGLPEPHHGLAGLRAGSVRVPRRGFDGEPASDGLDDSGGGRRRHREQSRSRRAGGAQHLRGDGGRQAGEEAADDARRGARGVGRGQGGSARHAGRDVPALPPIQARRVGALQPHRHRMGCGNLSGLPAVSA